MLVARMWDNVLVLLIRTLPDANGCVASVEIPYEAGGSGSGNGSGSGSRSTSGSGYGSRNSSSGVYGSGTGVVVQW